MYFNNNNTFNNVLLDIWIHLTIWSIPYFNLFQKHNLKYTVRNSVWVSITNDIFDVFYTDIISEWTWGSLKSARRNVQTAGGLHPIKKKKKNISETHKAPR